MPTTKIVINLPGEHYDVRIGDQITEDIGQRVRLFNKGDKALIITDQNIAPLYLGSVNHLLSEAGYKVFDITVPAGEASKSLECVAEIWDAMAQNHLTRDSVIIALGGGVVGDITGFVASTYMRGIDFVQVPTSLLAMVDSSVGGKTAINLEAGKNLIGTFKQPSYVCAATSLLTTLPEREWACGCAEIAKSAVIDSDEFFFWLTEVAPRLVAREEDVVKEAITRSIVFKADVVAQDVHEDNGVRECLNYGHTLGHAIESVAGYGTYSHGQAVAEGMRFAARLGAALIGTPLDFVQAQDSLLDALGLPELSWSGDTQALLEAMAKDKKVRTGHLRFVLPRDIGNWQVVEVEQATVEEHLQAKQKAQA